MRRQEWAKGFFFCFFLRVCLFGILYVHVWLRKDGVLA